MNIFKLFSSKSPQRIPAPVSPPEPWPDPPAEPVDPEPSCFIKGIVKSMIQTPENWVYSAWVQIPGQPDTHSSTYTHTSGLSVWIGDSFYYGGVRRGSFTPRRTVNVAEISPKDSTVTRAELILLGETFDKYLEGPRLDKLKKEEELKEASNRVYFENIGCPKTL
jgi:hypothetical protein